MKKFLIIALYLTIGRVFAQANPAYPGKITITLDDGRHVTLTHRGDEHYSFFTDDDGNTYQRNGMGGFMPISRQEVNDKWKALSARARTRRAARTRGLGESSGAIVGHKKGIVILMEFPDKSFVTKDVNAVFTDFFNKEGYSGYGMSGSVRDYFKAQSYGALDIEFDVVGPYVTANDMAYYGAHAGESKDSNPAMMAKEACLAADSKVNFSDYDWDGDGEVDQVFVIYAGVGESQDTTGDNRYADTIWPHEWAMQWTVGALMLDGVRVDTYACGCELRGVTGTTIDGIGTACHEFSHCLGLPDFYDTSDSDSFGTGYWDIMAAGCYNDDSCTPAGYTSYERWFAGWLEPEELKEMTTITDMKPLVDAPEAYILYNEADRNEYYLLENRQLKGFDAGLDGHGLLVLHVDYDASSWAYNEVNTDPTHQRMTIIPADGVCGTIPNNLAGDPFPGSRKKTALTNDTKPAAKLYNPNVDGQKLMSKPLDHITESEDGLISFVACRPDLEVPNIAKASATECDGVFTITWPAVEGALSYELELTESLKVSDVAKASLQSEFTFDGVISNTLGFTDISSNLSKYDLSGWSGNCLYTSPNGLRIGTSKANGYVRTPVLPSPQSGKVTIVMGSTMVKGVDVLKATIKVGYIGNQVTYESAYFEMTEDGKLVFHFDIPKESFWIEVEPETRMNLDYLAIYEGEWTAEQLGVELPGEKVAGGSTTYVTDTNSITLSDLNPARRYYYSIRAVGEEGFYSKWSLQNSFEFGSTGMVSVQQVDITVPQRIYDLNGRYVGTDFNSLRKGIYISNGKKIVK